MVLFVSLSIFLAEMQHAELNNDDLHSLQKYEWMNEGILRWPEALLKRDRVSFGEGKKGQESLTD